MTVAHAEVEAASRLAPDSPEWEPFVRDALGMHLSMLPAVQHAVKMKHWKRTADPIEQVRFAATNWELRRAATGKTGPPGDRMKSGRTQMIAADILEFASTLRNGARLMSVDQLKRALGELAKAENLVAYGDLDGAERHLAESFNTTLSHVLEAIAKERIVE